MRVAVIGGGVSGLGAAYVLSRSGHEVHVFERDAQLGGHVNTVVHDGLALDTGFIVSNERNYPLLTRLCAELGVAFQPSEMSFSVSCDACGLEYAGRKPFAQWRNATSAQFTSLLWEIGRWLRTARTSRRVRRLRGHRARRLPGRTALLAALPPSLHRPADFGPLVGRTEPDARRSRPRTRSASSTITGCSGFGVIAGERSRVARTPTCRPCVDTSDSPTRTSRFAACAATSEGVLVRTDDDAVRRFDRAVVATHADEALALLEDPSDDERSILGSVRVHAERRRPAHRLVAPPPRPRRPRVVELPRRRSRAADRHLLPESPAAARHRDGLPRDAEPARVGRARHPPDLVQAPALHGRRHPRAAPARRALRRASHRVRGRVLRQRLPRGRPRRRRAGSQRHSGRAGEIGALRGDARARAPRADTPRLQVPGRLLARRPGRAARARPPAPARLREPSQRGDAAASPTTSTATSR